VTGSRLSPDGFTLDPSRERLDLDRIERWLAAESYWARGRSRARIARSIEHSLVWGLYAPVAGGADDGAQVGFFRVVTDQTTFAWLCDVFIDDAYRGRGLAQWALSLIRDDILGMGVYRILLATADAHGVYARLGFGPHAEPEKWMELTGERG
jgi:GNAT superfamily N-acetyltransferase